MTDDTTTWLKKNPVVNPLRRSLKASLMFRPPIDMDASIMSNPDKAKEPEVFIPRMLQRANMRSQKFKFQDFKVPDMVTSKSSGKKVVTNSATKSMSSTSHVPVRKSNIRKSVLPVPKPKSRMSTKQQERKSTVGTLQNQNVPVGSAARKMVKRNMMDKLVDIQKSRKNEEANDSYKLKPDSDITEFSIPRSILKMKRNSMRRISQMSIERSKSSKRVLFKGLENSSCEEKENDLNFLTAEAGFQKDFDDFSTLEDPTVFLTFPGKLESSPIVVKKPEQESKTVDEPSDQDLDESSSYDVRNIVKIWREYQENINSLECMRNSVEKAFMGMLEQILDYRNQFMSYKRDSEEKYKELKKLAEELESNLNNHSSKNTKPKRSSGRKSLEKVEKLSEKSKVIKKNLKRNSLPSFSKRLCMDMIDADTVNVKRL